MTLVIASLGLMTALAWDDTLRTIFGLIFKEASLGEKILYSLIVTLIAVIVSLIIGKWLLNKVDSEK
jgi:ABC-type spermidine/putrescine transport system permease subunit II